jgi:hypothetical protein
MGIGGKTRLVLEPALRKESGRNSAFPRKFKGAVSRYDSLKWF